MERRLLAKGVARLLVLGAQVALLAAGIAPRVEAQVLYGSLVGHVRDSSGAAIAGAAVIITHVETKLSRETVTETTGAYNFSTVPTGTYTIKVSLSGFKTFARSDVPVTLNSVTRIDATLHVGQMTEMVEVTAERTVLQADRAEVRLNLDLSLIHI